MTGTIGRIALLSLVVFSCGGVPVHLAAIRQRTDRTSKFSKLIMLVLFAFAALASLCLILLLLREDNRYAYVAEYTGPGLSTLYRIAAFWGGNEGSLLFWCLVLTVYGFIAAFARHEDNSAYSPWVNLFLGLIILFFSSVTAFAANPFAVLVHPAAVGSGLSPLLQNPGMTVHPVNVYLGYIGFSVPFAYSMAGLAMGRSDATWLRVTRRWTLVSWLFLSIGIVYGAHWSYEELGWGGYWAWDPVENASLLPWLTATAFLHSAIVQEKRGMLKGWNVVLISLTYWLTVLGTYLTRSGVLWSIHAFANSSLGQFFLVYLIIGMLGSSALIVFRWKTLKPERHIESVVSKESGFMLNNLLFLSCTFAVLWGTIFPIISKSVTGSTIMVSAPFYNAVTLPLAVCIVLLMGIGPVIAWHRSSLRSVATAIGLPLLSALGIGLAMSGVLRVAFQRTSILGTSALIAATYVLITVCMEFYGSVRARVLLTHDGWFTSFCALMRRNRRRYGGYVVHLALAIMVIGVAGSGAYHVDLQQTLKPGQSTETFAGYKATFEGMEVTGTGTQRTMRAVLLIQRGGRVLGALTPGATFFANGEQPSSDVSLFSRPLRDLYVVMLGTEQNQAAVFDFHVNPLVEWIWFGGYLFILGTVISLWPESTRRSSVRLPHAVQQAYQNLADIEYDFRMGKLLAHEYATARTEIELNIQELERHSRQIRSQLEHEVQSSLYNHGHSGVTKGVER